MESRKFTNKFPLWTFGMMLLSGITYLVPELRTLLVYDRSAILAGEIWRLISGHCVHFTIQHLLYDVFAFSIVGWLLEVRYRYFVLLCSVAAVSISGVLLFAEPNMRYYGGLSGIVHGMVIFATLWGFREIALAWRICSILVFLAIFMKTLFELLGNSSFVFTNESAFIPIPLSHAVGILVALGLFLLLRQRDIYRICV